MLYLVRCRSKACLQLTPRVIAHVLLSSVQFQLVQVEGFRLHLHQRDLLLKDLDRAEKERLKAMEEKHRAATAGTSPSPRRSSVGVSLFGKKSEELVDLCLIVIVCLSDHGALSG